MMYPVWYEMVETQAVGVRVILPCKLLVVDLRKLESCKNRKKKRGKILHTLFKDRLRNTLFAILTNFIVFPPCLGPENSTSGSSQIVPSACITAVAVVYGRLTRFFPCSS